MRTNNQGKVEAFNWLAPQSYVGYQVKANLRKIACFVISCVFFLMSSHIPVLNLMSLKNELALRKAKTRVLFCSASLRNIFIFE